MRLSIACTFDPDSLAGFAQAVSGDTVDIVILPELCDGGYKRLTAGGGPDAADRLAAEFTEFSRTHALNLIAGSMALRGGDGQVRNTSIVYSRGREVARFDKVHLFRPLDDHVYFAPGQTRETVTLPCASGPIRCGVIICYDLRFPELVRPWFKSGLDLLFVPARWPRVRDSIWKVLLQARAIENQCFVFGIDSRDDEGGGSYLFGPAGEELFALGPDPIAGEPDWYVVTIDTDMIAQTKTRLDTHRDAVLL